MSRGVTTAGVLLETSCGALTVDLFGADAPVHVADFVNLCRCKAWNGAVVTSVIPDVAVIFSHAACEGYEKALEEAVLASSSCAPSTTELHYGGSVFWNLAAAGFTRLTSTASPPMRPKSTVADELGGQQQRLTASSALAEVERCKRHRVTALTRRGPMWQRATTTGAGAGSLGHKGLLLVPAQGNRTFTTTGTTPTPSLSPLCFALTLGDRNMDFLETEWLTIGEVTEGLAAVLPRLRAAVSATGAAPPTRPSPWPKPIRLVRLKHSTVLETAGTEPFLEGRATTPSMAPAVAVLKMSGCFAHWASAEAVRCANQTLVHTVQQHQSQHEKEQPRRLHRPGESGAYRFLVRLPAHTASACASTEASEVVSIEYEPHYTADFLSSDDELAADLDERAHIRHQATATSGTNALWEPATRMARDPAMASRKAQQARREQAHALHEQKANETRALMLNVLNGITDVSGEVRPPENVLFVCKLNPVTTGDGLAMVFAQFGKVVSADVIVDAATKQSLCYGFVEFDTVEACYRAFTRMDRALVDDCRIHVDFSQSVSKLWAQRQRQQRQEQQQQGRQPLRGSSWTHGASRKRERDEDSGCGGAAV